MVSQTPETLSLKSTTSSSPQAAASKVPLALHAIRQTGAFSGNVCSSRHCGFLLTLVLGRLIPVAMFFCEGASYTHSLTDESSLQEANRSAEGSRRAAADAG